MTIVQALTQLKDNLRTWVTNNLKLKVDKEEGKGLSTNDFTDADAAVTRTLFKSYAVDEPFIAQTLTLAASEDGTTYSADFNSPFFALGESIAKNEKFISVIINGTQFEGFINELITGLYLISESSDAGSTWAIINGIGTRYNTRFSCTSSFLEQIGFDFDSLKLDLVVSYPEPLSFKIPSIYMQIDETLSEYSIAPVQNKAVAAGIEEAKTYTQDYADSSLLYNSIKASDDGDGIITLGVTPRDNNLIAPGLYAPYSNFTILKASWDDLVAAGDIRINPNSSYLYMSSHVLNGELALPSNVVCDSNSLSNCTELTAVYIPATMELDSTNLFGGCSKLKLILVDAKNPGLYSKNALNTVNYNCVIASESQTVLAGCGTSIIPCREDVTTIGTNAFRNSALTNLSIPANITTIGEKAFENSENLTDIEVLNNNIIFKDNPFKGTAYYKNEANWEDDLFYIGNSLLEAKTTITGPCTVKDGITTVVSNAFNECVDLTEVTLPESLQNIGYFAFNKCQNLTGILIPDGVVSIESGAFYKSGITSLNIPASVNQIGDTNIVAGCDNLASITVDSANTGYSADGNCLMSHHGTVLLSGCNNSIIPETVQIISNSAFSGLTKLTTIKIPKAVHTISVCAFSDCTNLQGIYLPKSLKEIGINAFTRSGITDIYYAGTEDDWANIDKYVNDFDKITVHFNCIY